MLAKIVIHSAYPFVEHCARYCRGAVDSEDAETKPHAQKIQQLFLAGDGACRCRYVSTSHGYCTADANKVELQHPAAVFNNAMMSSSFKKAVCQTAIRKEKKKRCNPTASYHTHHFRLSQHGTTPKRYATWRIPRRDNRAFRKAPPIALSTASRMEGHFFFLLQSSADNCIVACWTKRVCDVGKQKSQTRTYSIA